MNKPSDPARPSVRRRSLFAGAGVVGAAAAASALLPSAPAELAAAPQPRPAPVRGGGYSLSEHVRNYYKTTRI